MKPAFSAEQLIRLLYTLTNQENIPIGKTKLVKLLYLLEVEFYRRYQRRLTELKWVFLHYGPYPVELNELLGSPDVEVLPRPLGDGRRFEEIHVSNAKGKSVDWDPAIIRLAKDVVSKWAGLSLNLLLDYVYFETEPMINAKRGQELDFSTVKPRAPVREIKLDRKKLNQIRNNLEKHLKELKVGRAGWDWNPLITDGIKIWDEGINNLPDAGEIILSPDEEEE